MMIRKTHTTLPQPEWVDRVFAHTLMIPCHIHASSVSCCAVILCSSEVPFCSSCVSSPTRAFPNAPPVGHLRHGHYSSSLCSHVPSCVPDRMGHPCCCDNIHVVPLLVSRPFMLMTPIIVSNSLPWTLGSSTWRPVINISQIHMLFPLSLHPFFPICLELFFLNSHPSHL